MYQLCVECYNPGKEDTACRFSSDKSDVACQVLSLVCEANLSVVPLAALPSNGCGELSGGSFDCNVSGSLLRKVTIVAKIHGWCVSCC